MEKVVIIGTGCGVLTGLIGSLTFWIFNAALRRAWPDSGDGAPVAGAGAVVGALAAGVAAGAFGAHALKARLSPDQLVIWQTAEPFSLGANLATVSPAIAAKQWSAIEAVVAKFQQTSMRLKYSLIPTVCAVRGLALGGGCEFVMHADRVVAALESYIGLVEVGVGLLPAGGGSKEFAIRAAEEVRRGANGSRRLGS